MKFRFLPLLLLLLLSLTSCGYNSLQEQEESVFSAFSDVETVLQRRADLIPNLVATVRASASHEKETLTGVIEARAKATSITLKAEDLSNPEKMAQFQTAQAGLGAALSKLMMVSERYPDLKANAQFGDLMHQLEGTENRIAVSRKRYNDAVKNFNAAIRKFPGNLTNNFLLHLERKEYFKAEPASQKVPEVKFD